MRRLVLALVLAACSRSAPTSEVGAPPSPSPSTLAEVEALVHHEGGVRWTTVATLLGDGTEACIDGRSDEPVLGTPGGDVGEILVGLAALEKVAGRPISADHLEALFDAYEASFGRLYLHTDVHAMERLARAVRQDPRLAPLVPPERGAEGLRAFVLAPPETARAPLLELLTRPEHVGCGHLRLALTEPAAYGLRPELVRVVLASTFRLAWRDPHALDFVVLAGEHREHAVVEVRLDHAVHAHSRVPMVAPHDGAREAFIHHPDVAAFVRRENGTFFLEHADELVGRAPPEERYLAELEALADRQMRATVARLAHGLPVVDVVVHHDSLLEVVGGRPGGGTHAR